MVVSDAKQPIDDLTPVEAETRRVLELNAAHQEQAERSLPAVAAATVLATAIVLTIAVLEHGGLVFGELTPRLAAVIVGSAWSAFALAALAYRTVGRSHAAYRAASIIEQLSRPAVLMTLMVLSGSAAVLFMLVSLPRGFVRSAQPPDVLRRGTIIEVVSHVAVAAVCLGTVRPTEAVLVILALGCTSVGRTMTSQFSTKMTQVRVERDLLEQKSLGISVTDIRGRIAREIHDGVGADVMALLLQLRRAARNDPQAEPLAQETQHILEDLRNVVWSLRSEQGTMAELGKLLDARCARLCPGATYERQPLTETEDLAIGPATALALLRMAPLLVQEAARRPHVSKIQLTLLVGDSLELTVHSTGSGDDAVVPEETSLLLRGHLAEAAATMTVSTTPSAWQAHVTIPLEPTASMGDAKP